MIGRSVGLGGGFFGEQVLQAGQFEFDEVTVLVHLAIRLDIPFRLMTNAPQIRVVDFDPAAGLSFIAAVDDPGAPFDLDELQGILQQTGATVHTDP